MMSRNIDMLDIIASRAGRLDARIVVVVHSAARVTEAALFRDASVGPRLIVEAALRRAALARSGRHHAATSIFKVVLCIARCAPDDTIDVVRPADLYRAPWRHSSAAPTH